jgi:hypothetical protein
MSRYFVEISEKVQISDYTDMADYTDENVKTKIYLASPKSQPNLTLNLALTSTLLTS